MSNTKSVSIWNKFRSNRDGAVAVMFGMTIIPLMLFAGAALDYSRMVAERTKFQAALDASALAIVNMPDSLPVSELQKRAEAYFSAAYGINAFGPKLKITVSRVNSVIKVTGSTEVEMTLMKVAGYDTMTVGASTSVTAGRRKIEIALVLDNTGSMSVDGKMTALKAAVSDLVDGLKKKVVNSGDVKMSIVPFNMEVKIDTGHFNASWLRWDVVLENTALTPAEQMPPLPADWTGCLADRDQPHDATSEPAGILTSRYVAAKCHVTGLTKMEPLTTDLEVIRSRAQSMVPAGYTNLAIGYTMGLATLRSDSEFGTNASK